MHDDCPYSETIEQVSRDVKDMKILITGIDELVRDPETYAEIRRKHFRERDIERFQEEQSQRRTRQLSICAVVVSILAGLSAVVGRWFNG
jgi:hypothetical protein